MAFSNSTSGKDQIEHPSGISEPSQADRVITEKLKTALALIDIRVLDHFIVGETMDPFAEH